MGLASARSRLPALTVHHRVAVRSAFGVPIRCAKLTGPFTPKSLIHLMLGGGEFFSHRFRHTGRQHCLCNAGALSNRGAAGRPPAERSRLQSSSPSRGLTFAVPQHAGEMTLVVACGADWHEAVVGPREKWGARTSAVRGTAAVRPPRDGSRRVGDRFTTARTRGRDPKRNRESSLPKRANGPQVAIGSSSYSWPTSPSGHK